MPNSELIKEAGEIFGSLVKVDIEKQKENLFPKGFQIHLIFS